MWSHSRLLILRACLAQSRCPMLPRLPDGGETIGYPWCGNRIPYGSECPNWARTLPTLRQHRWKQAEERDGMEWEDRGYIFVSVRNGGGCPPRTRYNTFK